jgi:hypothetical protein
VQKVDSRTVRYHSRAGIVSRVADLVLYQKHLRKLCRELEYICFEPTVVY